MLNRDCAVGTLFMPSLCTIEPSLTTWLGSKAWARGAFGGNRKSSSVLRKRSCASAEVLKAKEKVSKAKRSRSRMVVGCLSAGRTRRVLQSVA